MTLNAMYDYSDASRIEQLIPESFCDSMDIKSYEVKSKYKRGKRVKRMFIRSVFYDFLDIVMNELMEFNHRFIAPQKEYFVFYIKEKSPESMRRIYNNGIYKMVDPIKSDGKIYEYFLEFHYGGRIIKRPMRVSYKRYMELVKRVNKGQRYYT